MAAASLLSIAGGMWIIHLVASDTQRFANQILSKVHANATRLAFWFRSDFLLQAINAVLEGISLKDPKQARLA